MGVSGVAEKRRIEEGNSPRYRTLVGLFETVRGALAQTDATVAPPNQRLERP